MPMPTVAGTTAAALLMKFARPIESCFLRSQWDSEILPRKIVFRRWPSRRVGPPGVQTNAKYLERHATRYALDIDKLLTSLRLVWTSLE